MIGGIIVISQPIQAYNIITLIVRIYSRKHVTFSHEKIF